MLNLAQKPSQPSATLLPDCVASCWVNKPTFITCPHWTWKKPLRTLIIAKDYSAETSRLTTRVLVSSSTNAQNGHLKLRLQPHLKFPKLNSVVRLFLRQ